MQIEVIFDEAHDHYEFLYAGWNGIHSFSYLAGNYTETGFSSIASKRCQNLLNKSIEAGVRELRA